MSILTRARMGDWSGCVSLLDSQQDDALQGSSTLNAQDEDGRTALHWAVSTRRLAGIALAPSPKEPGTGLDQVSAAATSKSETNNNSNNSEELPSLVARRLLRLGATPDTRDKSGMTPLHSAVAANCDASLARTMIQSINSAPPTTSGTHDAPASSSGDASARISRKKYVNATTKQGRTALHYACSAGSPALVAMLLEEGASVDARDQWRSTPLHRACGSSKAPSETELVRLATVLLERGADRDATDANGDTPFHVACMEHHSGLCKFLLHNGIDNGVQNRDGKYALQLAPHVLQDELIPIVKELRGIKDT